MKMNQKGKMWHLMCSLRLCSLKVHWIRLFLPRLSVEMRTIFMFSHFKSSMNIVPALATA